MNLVSARCDDAPAAAQCGKPASIWLRPRLADRRGLSEGIFNHFTLAVPETGDRYLQIPFVLHWSEVTASCFLEIGYDERMLSGAGDIER